MVMRFDLMARDFPDDSRSSPIAVDSEASSRSRFNAIRMAETALRRSCCSRPAAGLVWPRSGLFDAGSATTAAQVATTFFVLIWAGFIIGGNYFHYYYCHQWGQSNHFMFMYWGFFVLLVLMI
jgi:hypothetical protein